jgi:hypothetical protein
MQCYCYYVIMIASIRIMIQLEAVFHFGRILVFECDIAWSQSTRSDVKYGPVSEKFPNFFLSSVCSMREREREREGGGG